MLAGSSPVPPVWIKLTQNRGHAPPSPPRGASSYTAEPDGRERASPKRRHRSGSPRPKGHKEEGGVKARAESGRNMSSMLLNEGKKTAWPKVGVAVDVSVRRVTNTCPDPVTTEVRGERTLL